MKKIIFGYIVCSFFIAILVTPYIEDLYQIDSLTDPKLGQYRSDEMSFLKIFYLMGEYHENYYHAFKIARENLVGVTTVSHDVFTWRLPTIFYIWQILFQKGEQILSFFIFCGLVFLLCIFLILRKFTSLRIALFGAVMVIPYLIDTLQLKTAFLFTEWWGLFFFVFGITCLLYQKLRFALLFLLLATGTRELFLLPTIFLFLYSLSIKKHRAFFVIILTVTFLYYLFHRTQVFLLIGHSPQPNPLLRIHFYNLTHLQSMISFSMRQYVLFGLKTHFVVLFLGLLGMSRQLYLHKKPELIYLFLGSISFLLLLPFFSVADNDYWGIVFVPMLLSFGPLLLSNKKIS